MHPKDRKILNVLQENFPLEERPYLKIAQKLKISEREVLDRAQKLMEEGVIRRFGILINHKKLDYYSTLLGAKVSDEALPRLVKLVTSRPEVTHCYQREGDYNLWFTFLTPKKATFLKFFARVKKMVGEKNVLNLPTVRSFKLRTTFAV